jgi:hypothetical protein
MAVMLRLRDGMQKKMLGLHKRKRAAFALSVVAIAGLSLSPLMSGVIRAGIEKGSSLLAMFDARSPGGRPDGAMLDTKLRRAAVDTPRQYAMPKTRERPSPAGAFLPDSPIAPAGTASMPLSQISYVPGPSAQAPGVPFISDPSVPSPSIYDPSNPDPLEPLRPEEPGRSPATAVPEPALWLNMIAGFGSIAATLRFRKWRKRGATESAGV